MDAAVSLLGQLVRTAYIKLLSDQVQFPLIDTFLILAGGTVDITTHEIIDENTVRELHIPAGGPWGGSTVDEAFLDMLGSVLGSKVIQIFRSDCAYDYLQLLRDFEVKKRTVSHDMGDTVILRIPQCLGVTVERLTGKTFSDKIVKSEYNARLRQVKDKVFIPADICKNYFRKSVENIITIVRSIL